MLTATLPHFPGAPIQKQPRTHGTYALKQGHAFKHFDFFYICNKHSWWKQVLGPIECIGKYSARNLLIYILVVSVIISHYR